MENEVEEGGAGLCQLPPLGVRGAAEEDATEIDQHIGGGGGAHRGPDEVGEGGAPEGSRREPVGLQHEPEHRRGGLRHLRAGQGKSEPREGIIVEEIRAAEGEGGGELVGATEAAALRGVGGGGNKPDEEGSTGEEAAGGAEAVEGFPCGVDPPGSDGDLEVAQQGLRVAGGGGASSDSSSATEELLEGSAAGKVAEAGGGSARRRWRGRCPPGGPPEEGPRRGGGPGPHRRGSGLPSR